MTGKNDREYWRLWIRNGHLYFIAGEEIGLSQLKQQLIDTFTSDGQTVLDCSPEAGIHVHVYFFLHIPFLDLDLFFLQMTVVP